MLAYRPRTARVSIVRLLGTTYLPPPLRAANAGGAVRHATSFNSTTAASARLRTRAGASPHD